MNIQNIYHRAQEKGVDITLDCIQETIEFVGQYVSKKKIEESIAITEMLMDFSVDKDTIRAGLCSCLSEIENSPLEEIEKRFGSSLAQIVKSLQKLTTLTEISIQKPENQADVLRKMFLALAKDIRVVLIKLVGKFQMMPTFTSLSEEEKEQYSKEVLDLYAPIAARLGIYRIKRELEDLVFKYSHPKAYAAIEKQIKKLKKMREAVLKKGEQEIEELLEKASISGEVQGRMKEIYSIHQKLKRKEKENVENVYDIFAFRVLVHDIPECYTVLGLIHEKWKVMASRFKDYIAMPKSNGYKSLHTTIFEYMDEHEEQYPLEIQIRTYQMHEEAEYGSARHWSYKESSASVGFTQNWFFELSKTNKGLQTPENFEIFTKNLLGDKIFVLTEKGDIKSLSEESTPIDFAYTIHTEIGHHCHSAVVNGKIVPLQYKLQNGDVVKIITNKNVHPRDSWLSFVASSHARQRIRSYLRKHDKDFFLREGKRRLNEELKKMGGLPLGSNLSILKGVRGERNLTLKEREDILQRIGNGSLSAKIYARKITNKHVVRSREEDFIPEKKVNKEGEGVIVSGETGFQVRKAKCCNPVSGDPILAFVTRGGSFTIHNRDCSVLQKLDVCRLLIARWESDPVPTQINLVVEKKFDRAGLLQDISKILVENGVNLLQVHYAQDVEHKNIFFIVEMLRKEELEPLLQKVKKVIGVFDVYEISAGKMERVYSFFFK